MILDLASISVLSSNFSSTFRWLTDWTKELLELCLVHSIIKNFTRQHPKEFLLQL